MATTKTIKIDVLNRIKDLNKLNQQVAAIKQLEKAGIKTGNSMQQVEGKFKKMGTTVKKFNTSIAPAFRAELLSFMFAGMALKRLFGSIAKAATSSFKMIMESADITGTAIQKLGIHWEFLKFIIGDVINRFLTPLMPIIAQIINWLAKWISQHPKLTALIILGGLALGAFLVVASQFLLFLNALSIWRLSKDFNKFFGKKGLLERAGKFLQTGFAKGISVVIGVVFLYKFLKGTFELFKIDNNTLMERLAVIGNAAAAGFFLGFAVGGIGGAGIGLLIGVGAGVVINIVDWFWERMNEPGTDEFFFLGDKWGKWTASGFVDAMAAYLKEELAKLAELIFDGIKGSIAGKLVNPLLDKAFDITGRKGREEAFKGGGFTPNPNVQFIEGQRVEVTPMVEGIETATTKIDELGQKMKENQERTAEVVDETTMKFDELSAKIEDNSKKATDSFSGMIDNSKEKVNEFQVNTDEKMNMISDTTVPHFNKSVGTADGAVSSLSGSVNNLNSELQTTIELMEELGGA